ncbi:MAG: sulfur oxidation c-type cytochrome SoxA, partial [Comamonas sp.]
MKAHQLALAAAALGLIATSVAWAQKSTTEAIDEYREMLQDGNPAEL